MLCSPRGLSRSHLACLGLTASLTVSMVLGCGQEDAGPAVKSDGGHAKEVTKNMENFMKTNPYKGVSKEKVQVK